MNIKDKKKYLKSKYVYMNKVHVTCNQPIDDRAYTITIFHLL